MSYEIDFGNYLKKLRKELRLTIRQLEAKSGVSNAYLSQLETGKRGIPSPDILKKIHQPLGVSYDELMEKAGHITSEVRAELLPQTKEVMESYNLFSEVISNAADALSKSFTTADGKLDKKVKNEIVQDIKETNSEYSEEEILRILSKSNIVEEMVENLSFNEKVVFLNMLIEGYVDSDVDPKEIFKSKKKESIPTAPILRVPVLGSIAAGAPILAEEHIEEWTEIPNMWNLKDGEVLILKVKGDSMIGSRIYDGDRVVIKLQQEIENGEIAAVNINGDEVTLKRVKKTDTGQVILYPDNPKYDPTFITNENARVIGKVIQVMFEPKKV